MERKIALFLTASEAPFGDPRLFHYSPVPLTLGILQGYLRGRGFDVHSVDLNTRVQRFADIREWLPLYDKDRVLGHLNHGTPSGMEEVLDGLVQPSDYCHCDAVGISTGPDMSFFEIHLALLLARKIQQETGTTVVLGGGNLEFLWQFRQVFRELWVAIFTNFKFVFIGPSERSFAELMAGCPYRELPGAAYWVNGEVAHNPVDTPAMPRPDFRCLELQHYALCCRADSSGSDAVESNLIQFYKWPVAHTAMVSERNRRLLPPESRKESLFIPYIFNYDCTYRCAFCVQSGSERRLPTVRDARSVVDDLVTLTSEYQTEYLRFYNNAFNLSASFVREFCQLVSDRRLRFYWSDCARVNGLTGELVDMLYEAGCRKLVFGLDTASKKIGKLIDKRIDLDHARQVLRWCHERGIWTEVEVIVGLPYECEDDFQETFSFVQENLANGHLTGFHVNRYFVVPSSLLGRKPEQYGIKLHSSPCGYEEMLRRSAEMLAALTAPPGERPMSSPYPFQLLKYSEVAGRTVEQITTETGEKFRRMRSLVPTVNTLERSCNHQYEQTTA